MKFKKFLLGLATFFLLLTMVLGFSGNCNECDSYSLLLGFKVGELCSVDHLCTLPQPSKFAPLAFEITIVLIIVSLILILKDKKKKQ